MEISTSKLSLQKKVIRLTLIILASLFISENAFSRKNSWKESYMQVISFRFENSLLIAFQVFNYEFGTWGEHAYLEWCDFAYSNDDKVYIDFMRCEVRDQVYRDSTQVKMKVKLPGQNIEFITLTVPPEITKWSGNEDAITYVKNNNKKAISLNVRWFLPSNLKIKSILVKGKWHVNGFDCGDKIDGVIYNILPMKSLISAIGANSEQKYVIDQHETNVVKVVSESDAVVVKGSEYGEKILVYTTTGNLIKSITSNNDMIKINLPPNQIYVVQVGQSRYKVGL